jgi:DNA-binding NarL/FixJ family response regulator
MNFRSKQAMNPQLLPQAIIDAIENPIILKNQFGVVISCNRAYLNFSNLQSCDVIGYTAYDFLSKEEADCIMRYDQELLKGNKEVIQYSYQHAKRPVFPYSMDVHKSIIRESGSSNFGILVVIGRKTPDSRPPLEGLHLTPRESSVLELLVQGSSQKRIAKHLKLSPHTVADYCKTIYLKLGVHSRTEAQLLAITKFGIRSDGL